MREVQGAFLYLSADRLHPNCMEVSKDITTELFLFKSVLVNEEFLSTNMILNGNDFVRTSVRITMLKGRCDRLQRRIADPRQAASTQSEIARLEKRINELSEQLRNYLNLASEATVNPEVVALVDLPVRLIERRIGLGLSQSDLADATGQARQCISRYERTLYAGASLARLIQIDSLLRAKEVQRGMDSRPMAIEL